MNKYNLVVSNKSVLLHPVSEERNKVQGLKIVSDK